MCSTSKLSKCVTFLAFAYKAISNQFLLIHTHQDLLYMPDPLFQINHFLNKHHYIWVHFDDIFGFKNQLKDGAHTPLPVNILPNKLATIVSINVGGNPPFGSFVSFLIVSPISFTSNPGTSSYLTIYIFHFFI